MLFINYVDRGALPTAAHLIQEDMQLTESQLGLLFSAFFLTYSLVQIPVGWLAERYGAHRVLSVGLTLWSVATICLGFAHTFPVLLGLRLLLGIGESGGFPCMSKLVAAVMPLKSLGLANGVVSFGYIMGPSVGTLVGGLIIAAYGWRTEFWVFGAVSLLWLVPWSRVKLPPQAVRRSDADHPNTRTILKQPALWGTSLGLFATNYVWYFMLTWMPFYLVKERGFSTVEMAKVAGLAYLINSLTAVIAGWVMDRLIKQGYSANRVYKLNMGLTQAGSVVCMVAMALGDRAVALSALFAYQVLCGANATGCYAVPQILAGPRAAGRWVGIQNSIGNFAGIAAPAFTGFIVDATHHFTAAFLLAGAVCTLGIVGWVWMLPELAELPWDRQEAAAAPGIPAAAGS